MSAEILRLDDYRPRDPARDLALATDDFALFNEMHASCWTALAALAQAAAIDEIAILEDFEPRCADPQFRAEILACRDLCAQRLRAAFALAFFEAPAAPLPAQRGGVMGGAGETL